jgi:hypothetical protein
VAWLETPTTAGNIAFDSLGHGVSGNAAFFTQCAGCVNGTAVLVGTGYENHAATGWLTTTAPVTPGSTITLTLAVMDANDGSGDSIVLLDNFAAATAPNPPLRAPITTASSF